MHHSTFLHRLVLDFPFLKNNSSTRRQIYFNGILTVLLLNRIGHVGNQIIAAIFCIVGAERNRVIRFIGNRYPHIGQGIDGIEIKCENKSLPVESNGLFMVLH